MATKEALELIEKVNALYSGAISQLTTLYTESMNQLITITFGILGFGAVVVPLLISWFQNRQFSKEQKALKKEIQDEVQRAVESLRTQLIQDVAAESERIKTALAESKSSLEKEIARIESQARGQSLHLQVRQLIDNKHYAAALDSAAKAAFAYTCCQNEKHLRRVWRLAESTWAHINKQSFEQVQELDESINKAIDAISKKNEDGRYDDLLLDINRKLRDAKAK